MTTALNLDVYAHLLTFISFPADLLAVALTSCDLFRLGMPELRYRSIRTHLGNNALWRFLAENPALASRVRELVILRENAHGLLDKKEMERVLIHGLRCTVPSGRVTEADVEESERLLIQALRVLINLESFTWDRKVPLINVGQEVLPLFGLVPSGDVPPQVYSEDVWTALRDRTQVKKLIVTDLGRNQTMFANTLSIFDSSMYTLQNLTHVELKIDYTPFNEAEGVTEDDDSDNSSDINFPPRINTDRLQALLHSCPDLEFLALEIYDHSFYIIYGGDPFTDISSILAGITWPRLTSLQLGDVVVGKQVITQFLNRHPTLQFFAAYLSISVDRATQNFELDMTGLKKDALPNLTRLAVHPKLARPILCGVPDYSTITELTGVEPRDWDAPEVEIESPVADFDTWSELPLANVYEDDNIRLERAFRLREMRNLKSLSLRNLTEVDQLEALAKLTPNLESLSTPPYLIKSVYDNPTPHTSWLPFLANWPRLTMVNGICLWPPSGAKGSEIEPELAKEILKTCPNMKEIPWRDGAVVKFMEGGNHRRAQNMLRLTRQLLSRSRYQNLGFTDVTLTLLPLEQKQSIPNKPMHNFSEY
ncbi:uncharacterized protein LACBIDRAFT_323175 [Laccaria bicolor S238N-H82]|uniref:Predicted protein n=1 Tax=Laccaria bicolor (strain S238N-H82 / ATCC MYA-4686) TaxID=486041 RepID=B0CZC9_LACBS|nr:uncharacterized protein LACBIDRAFT_323175 [Laccaria bicolor S238N-H82]EDR12127.1 predicted protein [Laccaria bicolor S238N-H82]|eukprot:XP_001876391.1 predicted protein [Laccaria bicolor S238N-H82]